MKHIFCFSLRVGACLAALLTVDSARAQGWNWTANLLVPPNNHGARATTVALDDAGNSLVAGMFRDTLRCGATTLVSAGRTDIFAGKISPTGQWLWVVSMGGADLDSVSAVAATPTGGLVLTGTVPGNTPVGPTVVPGDPSRLTMFVAQLSATGQWQWVVAPTANGNIANALHSGGLATDAAGRVWVSGQQYGFGGGPAAFTFGGQTLPATTNRYISSFVACLSPTGQWQWVNTPAGAQGNSMIGQLAVDAAHDALFVGGNEGEPYPACPTEFGMPHGFVGRMAATTGGAWQWVQADQSVYYDTLGTTPGGMSYFASTDYSNSQVLALVTDGAGRVFVGGQYAGHAGLGGQPAAAALSWGSSEMYVNALDAATGARQWSRGTTTHNSPGAWFAGLVLAPGGDVTLLANCFYMGFCGNGSQPPPPTIEFGDSSDSSTHATPNFGFAAMLARYAGATGQCRWVQQVAAEVTAAASVGGERLVVASGYVETDAFGPGTATGLTGFYVTGVIASLDEAAPLVRALSATAVLPGATVTVTGANFTGATQVLIGNISVPFTVVNATTIVLTIPQNLLFLNGNVVVVGPAGTGVGPYFETLPLPNGLAADADAARLTLWPNPAHDLARLTLGATPTDVTILDGVGRVVRTIPNARGTVALPLADLPAGTYTVRAGARVARLVRQ